MTAAVLEIDGLVYRYAGADGATVRVSGLTVARGESLVLTGTSGEGKSTLLHLISGLMDPSAGRVRVDGTDIHGLRGAVRDRFRGRTIGMVFQSHHLLGAFTAAQNVEAALKYSGVPSKEHAGRARELLTALGIDRPDAGVGALSVGQQQRVAVARAVACGPVLVLADEPTAALDPENAAGAVGVLMDACARVGASLVCVTHDATMVDRFDRHLRLGELAGEPVGEGAGV